MPNLGFPEILLILVVVLLLFGAKRLPEIGASFGKGIREFKRSMTEAGDASSAAARTGAASGAGAGSAAAVVGGSSERASRGVSPLTDSLNSRMPDPSDRPISGRRLAPNSSSASPSRRTISMGPTFAMRPP